MVKKIQKNKIKKKTKLYIKNSLSIAGVSRTRERNSNQKFGTNILKKIQTEPTALSNSSPEYLSSLSTMPTLNSIILVFAYGECPIALKSFVASSPP